MAATNIGDVVKVSTTFTVGGVPTNPTTVVLTVRAPDGTQTTPAHTNPSTGVFEANVTPDQAGIWYFRFTGSGAVVAVEEGSFYVFPSLFTAGIDHITIIEAKTQLEVSTAASDALIEALITAASRAVNLRYQREFTPQATATRRFRADGCLVDLAPYDLRSATAVRLHPESGSPQTLAANLDYALEPIGGSLGGSFQRLRLSSRLSLASTFSDAFGYAQVEVEGGWGLFNTSGAGAVPEDLKRAAIITVGSWLDRAVAEYGIAGTDGMREVRPDLTGTWAIPSAAHRVYEPWGRVVV